MIATTTPGTTIEDITGFFKKYYEQGKLKGIGISTFGPINLNKKTSTYGFITSTNKSGWENTNIVGLLKQKFNVPVIIETDANAAALGEFVSGAAKGIDTFVYITVGSGIGGGGMIRGKLMHGLLHPEMGHIIISNNEDKDNEGSCQYHQNCLEGLASGVSLEKRWSMNAKDIPDGHPAWQFEAEYLAKGIINIICILSPQKIIIGGGVMKQSYLLNAVKKRVVKLLNGYFNIPQIKDNIDDYIVSPSHGDESAIAGAFELAIKGDVW